MVGLVDDWDSPEVTFSCPCGVAIKVTNGFDCSFNCGVLGFRQNIVGQAFGAVFHLADCSSPNIQLYNDWHQALPCMAGQQVRELLHAISMDNAHRLKFKLIHVHKASACAVGSHLVESFWFTGRAAMQSVGLPCLANFHQRSQGPVNHRAKWFLYKTVLTVAAITCCQTIAESFALAIS